MGLTDSCTDLANAERLIERFGDRFRYVTTWKKLLAWNGRQWVLDDAAVRRFAIKSAQKTLEDAKAEYAAAVDALAASQDDGARKRALAIAGKHVTFAIKSQSARSIDAAITLAKCAETIAIDHTALDADPWLLNVANGTIDMRMGAARRLRPHNPRDLCTKLAPIEYDPNAKAPQWDMFVSWAMQANADLVAYLQRIVGYAAVGVVREHILGFCFGEDGKNGKSTFLGRIQHVLGDYSKPAPRGLLFTTHTPQHPTELASLYGARFVTCSEVAEGQCFDEAKVKDLTGGDMISARRMGEDFWTFAPTHTLFIAGNHKPTVRGTDGGIWRRIRLIPWLATVAVENMDKDLPAKLDAEAPGILAWIVRGALEWQEHGLGDPLAVTEATKHYREESDPLGEFFTLRCAFESDAKIARKMLRGEYERFCDENSSKPIEAKAFAKRLREKGVTDGGTVAHFDKRLDAWAGVRLKTDAERSEVGREVGTKVTNSTSALGETPFLKNRGGDVPTSPYVPAKGAAA